jgi:hypothetical protein
MANAMSDNLENPAKAAQEKEEHLLEFSRRRSPKRIC